MSINTGRKPRHTPTGKHVHTCSFCGVTFRDDRPTTKYCCFDHKNAANNRTYYARHRKEMILRVTLNRHRKGKGRRGSREPRIDQMTNDELLEYVRNNPNAISVRRR